MRILIADDDETLRTELGDLLQGSGYEVVLARDGREALERLRGETIDVALLDIAMPQVDGLQVLRAVHAACPTTTFMIMTGFGTVEMAMEAVKAGASEFVVKPFDYDVLERTLRAMEQKLQARRELVRRVEAMSPREGSPPATDVVAVLVTYMDGTLIGSRVKPGEGLVDQDLLGATLNLIQDFMQTSFPLLRGEALRTIVQGRYQLLIDAGESVYLTVVVLGAGTPGLFEKMRHRREVFETANRAVLAHWRGMPQDAVGLDPLFETFLPSVS